jgi:hypothetical protein
MSLPGTFLEMLTGLGRAREAGLGPTECIIVTTCPSCGYTWDHVDHEEHDESGHVWSVMVCLNCRAETSRQLR